MQRLLVMALSWYSWLTRPRHHNERGLSNSTETAILAGGVAILAVGIVGAITLYVNGKLPK